MLVLLMIVINLLTLQLCPPKKITRQQSTVPDPYVIVDLPLDLVATNIDP